MWSKGDRADPTQLAANYDVVDLVAVKADDLPRANLLGWVAEVEQSVQAGALPERVRELGERLAEAGEPGLTRSFDLWLAVLGRKWDVELPSIRPSLSAPATEGSGRWSTRRLGRHLRRPRPVQAVSVGDPRDEGSSRHEACRRAKLLVDLRRCTRSGTRCRLAGTGKRLPWEDSNSTLKAWADSRRDTMFPVPWSGARA